MCESCLLQKAPCPDGCFCPWCFLPSCPCTEDEKWSYVAPTDDREAHLVSTTGRTWNPKEERCPRQ